MTSQEIIGTQNCIDGKSQACPQVSPEENPRPPVLSHSVEGSKCGLKVSFPRFSREICAFEKNVKLQKMFCIKSSTKKVLLRIFVAIILTELQRFESIDGRV